MPPILAAWSGEMALEVEILGAHAAVTSADRRPLGASPGQYRRQAKCFLGVHAAWLSFSPTVGCWSGANGLPICDSTWVGVMVWAHRSASASRSGRSWRWWVWVTVRRKARHSHSI